MGCGERGVYIQGVINTPWDPEADTPLVEIATEVGGKDPTGMHSYLESAKSFNLGRVMF